MNEELLKTFRELTERTLEETLPAASVRPAILHEAMRHAVGAGGKRIRPCVCLAAAEAVGGKREDARFAAAAIELLHNYTLVHDDLPAMDNDEIRRGKPSVWKKFGHANAILCGDALQALAFGVAAQSPRNVEKIITVLSLRGIGVVQGQVEDIIGAASPSLKDSAWVDFVYAHKTSDLFVAAAEMGALAAGGSAQHVEKLSYYGYNLGMAFQFEDDLLDGDSPYDRTKTERLIVESTDAAIDSLAGLPGDTSILLAIAKGLVGRKA